jgi:hypothetical protein
VKKPTARITAGNILPSQAAVASMWDCTHCTSDAVDPENCTHVQATSTSHDRDGFDSVPRAWARDVVHAQHKSACLALIGSEWQ